MNLTKGARVAYTNLFAGIEYGTVVRMVMRPTVAWGGSLDWEWCAQVDFDSGNHERDAFDLMYAGDLTLV
jgi:hypothetical protein